MALIEGALQVREDIYIHTIAEKGKDLNLINLQLQHWVSITIEVAEIVCKCLDWSSPNLKKILSRNKA